MPKQNSIIALIMAAGTGERLPGTVPKQYAKLGGKAVIRYSVEQFLQHPEINQVIVVIHPDHQSYYQNALGDMNLADPVMGGRARQESVRLALQSLKNSNPDYVLIHDAARPFICQGVITRILQTLTMGSGSLVALPVQDSLKRSENEQLIDIKRDELFAAQTPQAFPYKLILHAHRKWKNEVVTDDTALAALENIPVKIIAGKTKNFKITTQDDLKMAEMLVAGNYEYRTGQGFDVHRFTDGDHVTLGNIKISFHKGVDAHSDGDVILHALTDALLGAIGENDIGYHFPPSDPKWRNADSALFIGEAVRMLEQKNGIIVNADVTLLCEEPKISPHRLSIQNRIAELLKIEVARVAIKATTTEKLGFIGRSEGLAAQALVTVKLPNV